MKYKTLTSAIYSTDIELDSPALRAAERDLQKQLSYSREMKRRHSFNRHLTD